MFDLTLMVLWNYHLDWVCFLSIFMDSNGSEKFHSSCLNHYLVRNTFQYWKLVLISLELGLQGLLVLTDVFGDIQKEQDFNVNVLWLSFGAAALNLFTQLFMLHMEAKKFRVDFRTQPNHYLSFFAFVVLITKTFQNVKIKTHGIWKSFGVSYSIKNVSRISRQHKVVLLYISNFIKWKVGELLGGNDQ